MITAETLRSKAIDSFGLTEAGAALLALDVLIASRDLKSDQDIEPVFLQSEWESTLAQAAASLEGKGTAAEVQGICAKFPVWRMVYQLERVQQPESVMTEAHSHKRVAYDPVDLGSAFHGGCLYYSVQTLVSTQIGGQQEAESVDVVVVRSDRTILNVVESHDARGRRSNIFRLTDGTLLQKQPTASFYATWSWDSIQKYLRKDYPQKTLAELAQRVYQHLYARVWLPDEDDYWVLVFAAITSYVQAVFDAVPLILLNGVGGTGKSDLGAAVTEVSCNGVMIGKVSPANMIRLMDEARGLVVIDDLESIGVRSGANAREQFSEMVQMLKVSYKKASAKKVITNEKRKTEMMNYFGVKIVSNTSGVDAILGTRMIQISTQNLPKAELTQFLERRELNPEELVELRNDLHCWAFDHVADVNHVYQSVVGQSTEREQEIAAPLRVMAELAKIPEAARAINRALAKQQEKKVKFATAEDGLLHVVQQMVEQGAKVISIIEVALRLRQAMNIKPTKKTSYVWMKPEWVSRKLREHGWVQGDAGRKNLFGFQMRLVEVSEAKRIELHAFTRESRSVETFCVGCAACPFKHYGCEILPYRVKKEGL